MQRYQNNLSKICWRHETDTWPASGEPGSYISPPWLNCVYHVVAERITYSRIYLGVTPFGSWSPSSTARTSEQNVAMHTCWFCQQAHNRYSICLAGIWRYLQGLNKRHLPQSSHGVAPTLAAQKSSGLYCPLAICIFHIEDGKCGPASRSVWRVTPWLQITIRCTIIWLWIIFHLFSMWHSVKSSRC